MSIAVNSAALRPRHTNPALAILTIFMSILHQLYLFDHWLTISSERRHIHLHERKDRRRHDERINRPFRGRQAPQRSHDSSCWLSSYARWLVNTSLSGFLRFHWRSGVKWMEYLAHYDRHLDMSALAEIVSSTNECITSTELDMVKPVYLSNKPIYLTPSHS